MVIFNFSFMSEARYFIPWRYFGRITKWLW